MVVAIDGTTVISQDVTSSGWTTYGANISVPDGTHSVSISFTNDHLEGACDRNLRIDRLDFSSTSGFEGEGMSLPDSQGTVSSDANASGSRGLLIWSDGSASESFTTTGVRSVSVRARGDQCSGAPRMVVAIDGGAVLRASVSSAGWATYAADAPLADGSHTVTVDFTNDYLGDGCDRNLRVDAIALSPTAAAPLAAAAWYVDPSSNAKRQADAWRSTRPADAAQMDKIAAQPEADWFGGWSGPVQQAVDTRVSTIAARGALPVLVAYDIPLRDCSSYSGGGAGSPEAYRTWIRAFAAGIGARPAVVILEPDALAGLDCLSAADRQTRFALLRDAVSVLASHPGVSVYLDGGHSGWHTAGDIAGRLEQAGIDQAQGFALNVSNFGATASETQYGDAVSALTGGKHFVVDTSRNGRGPTPDAQWCNPSGRALGDRPTAATGDPLADAYLWIKHPGESDGACNGGPGAGEWWADYALGLAQRAAY
jgi:endoglucanase